MSLPEPVKSRLAAAFADDGRMLALANRIIADFPEIGGERYGPDDIAQILRGFSGFATEALESGTGETRDLFLSTAIPAVVAQGETPATLARSTAIFGIMLSQDICTDLEGEERHAAASWLARFFGEYGHDAVTVAQEAG